MKKNKRKNKHVQQPKPNWPVIGGLGAIVVVFLVGMLIANQGGPELTPLANCITDAGATMYGAYWCPHCAEQKKLFGKEGFESVDYVECATGGPKDVPANPALCKEKDVGTYPTWIFGDNSRLTGTQPLALLAQRTGCEQHLPQ